MAERRIEIALDVDQFGVYPSGGDFRPIVLRIDLDGAFAVDDHDDHIAPLGLVDAQAALAIRTDRHVGASLDGLGGNRDRFENRTVHRMEHMPLSQRRGRFGNRRSEKETGRARQGRNKKVLIKRS